MKPIFERTKETDDHLGWVFPATADEEPGAEPDPLNGARSVRELYEIASTNYAGKPTVPVREPPTPNPNPNPPKKQRICSPFQHAEHNSRADSTVLLHCVRCRSCGTSSSRRW